MDEGKRNANGTGENELAQTGERLELTPRTYHILEQMAQARSTTPAQIVEDMVQQFQAMENLASLRQEYQRLTEKALMRTISRAEEKRMDALRIEMSALNGRMAQEQIRAQRDQQADALIDKSEHLLDLAHQRVTR